MISYRYKNAYKSVFPEIVDFLIEENVPFLIMADYPPPMFPASEISIKKFKSYIVASEIYDKYKPYMRDRVVSDALAVRLDVYKCANIFVVIYGFSAFHGIRMLTLGLYPADKGLKDNDIVENLEKLRQEKTLLEEKLAIVKSKIDLYERDIKNRRNVNE